MDNGAWYVVVKWMAAGQRDTCVGVLSVATYFPSNLAMSFVLSPGQPSGASSGVTGYASYGVSKGSGGGGGGPKYGGTNRCPRCDKAVYIAEKIVAAGSVSIL